MEKKYPIGGYAPGDYWHKACKTCGKKFTGDKHAWNCEPCGEKNAAAEKKFIEKFGYEDLFDYLSHNHRLNLLQSELTDLIDIVHKFHPQPPADADPKEAWKKIMGVNFDEPGAIESYCFYEQGFADGQVATHTGPVWVKGAPKERKLYHARFKGRHSDLIHDGIIEPVPNPEYWQAIASGTRISIKDHHIIEYLDENARP